MEITAELPRTGLPSSTRTTTEPRPAERKVIEVMDLKNPPPPDDLGEGRRGNFRLCYNDMSAAMRLAPCSAEVYQQIKTQRLDFNKKVNFLLTFMGDTVVGVSIKERPDSMPGFTKTSEAAEEHPGALVLERGPDGEAKTKRVPASVPENVMREITDGLQKMAARDMHPGSLIGGRFTILEVQSKIGMERIFVNPMPRRVE